MPPTASSTTPILNPAERLVWDRLAKQVSSDVIVLPSVRVTGVEQDHEADILVLLPDAGVVVVEVKGGSVSVDDRGQWWQGSGTERHRIDPVDQAMRTKHELRRYVETDPRWRDSSRTRVRWSHAVVTPYSTVADDFAQPDCPRSMLHGRDDLTTLAPRLHAGTHEQETGHRRPPLEDCELIQQILTGRHPMAASVMADADDRADRASRLTQEQAMLLEVTRLIPRVEVRGGAGSGKTMLALEQARQLTRGHRGRSAQRVALLCYSYGLAEFFTRALAGESRKRTPAFAGTFEDLGRQWGAPTAPRDNSHFWEDEFPRITAELAAALPDGTKYDAIIVDEAQDFADSWWTSIIGALRDPEEGGLFVYSDENQRIFARFGRPPVPLVPLVLDHNLRNTQQIAESFDSLAPMRMRHRGDQGPDVRFVPASAEAAIDVAETEVAQLLEDGWPAEHIALLTTGSRHPQQTRLQETLGQHGYWQTFWEGQDVFYGHVLGCKGLERRAVVLCVNEHAVRERSRERLYVGLSRATDALVVVGDPVLIEEMGGRDVARELGIR